MDRDRFDDLARLASTSRRGTLRAAVAVALAGLPAVLEVRQSAASCKPNRAACKRGTQCCSGVCKRQPGSHTRACRRAPNQGTCTIEQNACTQGIAAECGPPDSSCYCFLTTRGASFCGHGNTVNSCAECEAQFPGRFCFPGDGPQCGAFSCLAPCAG